MANTIIKASCGCGVVIQGTPEQVIEKANEHSQNKKHIVSIIGTIKPEEVK